MWDSFACAWRNCAYCKENAYFRATGNKMVETMVAEHKMLIAQKSGKVKENPSLHDKINAKERRKMRARVRVKQENLVVCRTQVFRMCSHITSSTWRTTLTELKKQRTRFKNFKNLQPTKKNIGITTVSSWFNHTLGFWYLIPIS